MTDDDVKLEPCPCPFCGEAKHLTIDPGTQASVYCGRCAALGPASWGHEDNRSTAIAAWNRRPNSSSPDGRMREALHGAIGALITGRRIDAVIAKCFAALSPNSEPAHNPDSPKP